MTKKGLLIGGLALGILTLAAWFIASFLFPLRLKADDALYEESLPLFDYDPQVALDIEEIDSMRVMGSTQVELTYASPAGGRVPATLVIPDGEGPFAGLILMHGMPGSRQAMYSLAYRYASAGAVVIAIDAPHARSQDGNRPAIYFTEQDREEQIQLILDLRRAVDLLVARSDVDPDRIAYIGRSYGAAMGGLLAGVEDRLQAYVLMVGDGGLVCHYTDPDNRFGGMLYELPRKQRNDWLDAMWPIEPIHFVGHAAPAALLFQAASRDQAVASDDAIRFQQAGSEPKEIMWYDSGHWPLPEEYLADQAMWLQQYIGIDASAIW